MQLFQLNFIKTMLLLHVVIMNNACAYMYKYIMYLHVHLHVQYMYDTC